MGNIPQLLKGFRDFLPAEKKARDYVAAKVTEVFKIYGFEPLETPTLEYASLLLGKNGTEADKLVYTFTDRGNRQVGLRYDQTVPTARVLAQYQNDLPKYFRRYQIQNVFRADKPQKGRYREFTQCDIDIFGSTSILAEAEIIACTYQAFVNLGFKSPTIHINHREHLIALLTPFATSKVPTLSLIQSLDKLDKIPESAVISELIDKGLSLDQATAMLTVVKQTLVPEILIQLIDLAHLLGVPKDCLNFSPTLARGLDYYTGVIFEITLPGYTFGSFGGGGRYDKLIHDLGGPSMPAVGVAFGFDRMVVAAKEENLIPESILASSDVLITVFDATTINDSASLALKLRQSGITTELFPSVDKLGKQLKYADQQHIPLAVVLGPDEISKNQLVLKDLRSGSQTKVDQAKIISAIHQALGTKH